MKLKLKAKIVTVLTACALLAGLSIAPVVAYAEETPVIDTENSVETSVSVEDEQSTEETETSENTEVSESVESEEITESVPETPAEEEIAVEEEKEDHTFEEFLAWTEDEAERYGYGEQYKQALQAIKTAATEKQITISTLCSLGLAAAVICYMIYKKVTDAKLKKAVFEMLNTFETLRGKLNELVNGTNVNSELEGKNGDEIKLTKKDVKKLKRSIAYYTEAFICFAEGVDMLDTKKERVLRKCNAALKEVDEVEEVITDENNKG